MGWLAALTLGCGAPAADGPPAPAPPDAPGPWRIGVTTIDAAGPDGRTLPIEVWYPAKPPRGAPNGEAVWYPLLLGEVELAAIRSPHGAARDAPPDARGVPYPTVVFSHGNGGMRIQSVYLTEYLASHASSSPPRTTSATRSRR